MRCYLQLPLFILSQNHLALESLSVPLHVFPTLALLSSVFQLSEEKPFVQIVQESREYFSTLDIVKMDCLLHADQVDVKAGAVRSLPATPPHSTSCTHIGYLTCLLTTIFANLSAVTNTLF